LFAQGIPEHGTAKIKADQGWVPRKSRFRSVREKTEHLAFELEVGEIERLSYVRVGENRFVIYEIEIAPSEEAKIWLKDRDAASR
jgi:hypothetical protein